jgi:hypothetical protein
MHRARARAVSNARIVIAVVAGAAIAREEAHLAAQWVGIAVEWGGQDCGVGVSYLLCEFGGLA